MCLDLTDRLIRRMEGQATDECEIEKLKRSASAS